MYISGITFKKTVLQRPQNNMQLTQVAVYTGNISFVLKIYTDGITTAWAEF